MPGKTTVTIWYLILASAVFASAGFMGLEIRERIHPSDEGETALQVTQGNASSSVKAAAPSGRDERAEMRRIAMIFRGTTVFQPIVTPKPTPTRRPLPTPTPTPLPLAMNYKIRTIMGGSAILVDYRLKPVVVREGVVVDDPLGKFRVEEVDPTGQRVRVRLLSNNYERWIVEQEARQRGRK